MDLRLSLLAAGFCTAPEAAAVAGGRWRARRFPGGFALVEGHDAGPVLFDTGYAPRFDEATRPFPYRLYRWTTPATIRPDETAAAQLAARGIAAESVRHVVLSHLHADHVAGLRDFPNAAFHALPEAIGSARGLHGLRAVRAAFLPSLLPDDFFERGAPVERRARLDLGPFHDGFDLFGDGQLLGVPLPGHAPGQMGLFLTPENGPPTLLAADAAWTTAAIRDNAPPPALGMRIQHDAAATRETLWRLHRLSHVRPDIRIVLSHEAP